MSTQQPEPTPQAGSTQHAETQPDASIPPGVVITDDYVTPSVPKLVAEENDAADQVSTPTDDDLAPGSLVTALPSSGGGAVGAPATITNPTQDRDAPLDDARVDEDGDTRP